MADGNQVMDGLNLVAEICSGFGYREENLPQTTTDDNRRGTGCPKIQIHPPADLSLSGRR